MWEIIKAIHPTVLAHLILGIIMLIALRWLIQYRRAKRWRKKKGKRKDYCNPTVCTVKPKGKPYYLFFDTETTGLPKDFNAPASPGDNWPRLVQLSWILTTPEGEEFSRQNHIIRPEGFTIPWSARRIHGISTKKALAEGESLESVLRKFGEDARQCCLCIGHNVQFDKKVVGSEFLRTGLMDPLRYTQSADTMKSSVFYCRIPRQDGKYKNPSLQELHKKLLGHKFRGAHDSMMDVTATKDCFFELIRQNVICIVRDEY